MSNGNLVPASALSRYYQTFQPSGLVIGDNGYWPPNKNVDDPFYFLVVVDLTDLKVVVSDTSDGTSVPAAVQKYAGNSQYFLYCIGNALHGFNAPQGSFYSFLQAVGSGGMLARVEQAIDQIGTGTLVNFSYALAATMAEDDLPGFEMSSFHDFSLLTMQFLPVTVNGQTIYAPVQPGV